jgi:hypothetical protein
MHRGVVHDGHTEFQRGLEIAAQIVDENALAGRQPDGSGAEFVDLARGLAHLGLAGDDDADEQLGELLARISAGAPGVRDQAGGDAGAAGHAHGFNHPGLDAYLLHQPTDESGRGHLQQSRDALLELVLRDGAGLEPGEQASRGEIGAEELRHGALG